MGLYIAGPGEGGIWYDNIGAFLPSGSPGDPFIWFGDVVHDPPHGEEPGGVHHQVARRITVKLPCHRSDGSCNFPPLAEAMREAGLEELEIYDGGQ